MEKERLIQSNALELENSYEKLPEMLFSRKFPSDIPNPKLLLFNEILAKELGLNESFLKSPEGVELLSGNKVLEGTTPIAQAYAGHQFGYFNMLGDGRAILLGEYITKDGQRIDIQLKGAGRTPYSRGGDGKAALGPMLREYIISEGMHALGIPTTRSLAVMTTGERIMREVPLIGAVLTRVAQSHIRVGTFQYVARWGKLAELKALADYTLDRHFQKEDDGTPAYLYLLKKVIERQAQLIAKWQLVGFIHGVMNTDNMAISGETIDYGPCAFMDNYNLKTVFSSIDIEGRYAYGNQPKIGAWNLARFAETLLPLLHENEEEAVRLAQKAVGRFPKLFKQYWYAGMRSKLGLFNEEKDDETLIDTFLELMNRYQPDYTNTFYNLTRGHLEDIELFKTQEFKEWHVLWQARLERQEETKEQAITLMERNNPVVIPRNHRVEEALTAATEKDDYQVMHELIKAITNPYDYSKDNAYYREVPRETGCVYKTYCGT